MKIIIPFIIAFSTHPGAFVFSTNEGSGTNASAHPVPGLSPSASSTDVSTDGSISGASSPPSPARSPSPSSDLDHKTILHAPPSKRDYAVLLCRVVYGVACEAVSAFRDRKRPAESGRWSPAMALFAGAKRAAAMNAPHHLPFIRVLGDPIYPRALVRLDVINQDINYEGLAGELFYPLALIPHARDVNSFAFKRGIRHISSHFHIGTEQIQEHKIRALSKTRPVVLYLHGGAFCLQKPAHYRHELSELAIDGNMIIYAPNYKKAPEHTAAEIVADTVKSYDYLTQVIGVKPDRICIMGDSAGGALVVLTLAALRERWIADHGSNDIPMFAKSAALLSPWSDLADSTITSLEAMAESPMDVLPPTLIGKFAIAAAGDEGVNSPKINAMTATVTGMPKTQVHLGTSEILARQIRALHSRLVEAEVDAELVEWDNAIHVPQRWSLVWEDSRKSIAHVARFILDTIQGENGDALL